MTSVALPKDGASKALESTFVPALLRVERSRDFPTTHSFQDASFIQSLALSTHLLFSKRELHSVASRSWCSAASEKAATRRRPASSTRLRTPGAPQRRCATRGPTAPSWRSRRKRHRAKTQKKPDPRGGGGAASRAWRAHGRHRGGGRGVVRRLILGSAHGVLRRVSVSRPGEVRPPPGRLGTPRAAAHPAQGAARHGGARGFRPVCGTVLPASSTGCFTSRAAAPRAPAPAGRCRATPWSGASSASCTAQRRFVEALKP